MRVGDEVLSYEGKQYVRALEDLPGRLGLAIAIFHKAPHLPIHL